MQLKMFVLSGAAVALWLVPLTALDKRIGWHKSMQGLTLCAAIACAVQAGNIARELSDLEYGESERTERALQLKAQGWGKAKIILELWGVNKGGSAKYKAAEAEYKRLVGE